MIDPDTQWFAEHGDRYAHIRTPRKHIEIDRQRAAGVTDECELEFRSLGDHSRSRRRILLWRVPSDNVYYDPDKRQILKIPFVLFADETVEDTDETLLPIIHEIMVDAAKRQRVI